MSQQAEQEIIACIMKKNSLLQSCDLTPNQFENEYLGDIYRTICDLSNAGEIADIITLGDAMRGHRQNHLTIASDIVKNCYADFRNFESYLKIVRKSFKKRSALSIAQSLQFNLNEDGDLNAIDQAISDLMSIDTSKANYTHTLDDCVTAGLKMVEESFENPGIVGVTTGLKALDDALGGFHKSDLIVIGARPAMGKAQPLYSKVLLESGNFIDMADIKIGDRLASVDGKESIVDGVFPQGVRPIYELELSDGRLVRSDIEHLWNIESSRFKGVRTVTTEKIMEMIGHDRYKNRISITGHSGEFGESIDLGIDPWLIGFLIGDGSLTGTSVGFSTGEYFILNKISSRIPKGFKINHSDRCNYRIVYSGNGNPILNELRKMKLCVKSHDKFIPDAVFSASKDIRFEFLMGLLESDGWSYGASLQFSSSSKRLSLDVQRLVRSIGGCASIRLKENVKYVLNGKKIPAKDAHILSIYFKDMESLIESERVTRHIGKRRKTSNPIVRSVKYIGEEYAQCIHVTHQDHLYITDGYIVTHNTALLLNFANNSGVPTGIISAEQGHAQAGLRFIGMNGSVDGQKMRTGAMEEDDWPKLTTAIHLLKGRSCYLNDEPGINITKLIKQAREWKFKYNIEILFVDYIQKIEGSDSRRNRTEQVTEVTRALKNLAREIDIPVVALAQVKRDVESRPNKRPSAGDMSDASEIEKEADIIMTMYRDEVYNPDTDYKGICELDVCKNRHGPIGVVCTNYIGRYMQFKDLGNPSADY